jgi:hypothetical protein
MRVTTLLTLAAAGLVSAATPALAQDAGGEKVNTIIVYGDDPCPASQGSEITVCARKAESERYRIPPVLRETPSTKSEAWNQRVLAYETVGNTGTKSCSPVGPGGVLGCTQKLIDAAYAEKKQETDVGFSDLIAAERAKRAAVVDADAAATQSRVEQAEKDYEARERARQEAAAAAKPGVGDPTVTAPAAKP